MKLEHKNTIRPCFLRFILFAFEKHKSQFLMDPINLLTLLVVRKISSFCCLVQIVINKVKILYNFLS